MDLITTTRRLVADIKSPDTFETLATTVLRAAHPDYAALIHVGTNEDGRTVRSPIDGIELRVHRGSRRLLIIQHTITAKPGLRRKWLAQEEGDLAKAKAIVEFERNRGTIRKATLVLCCSIDPDQELIRDVHAAAGNDLELDIWPGSRIADFLDRDPEGQWLRQQAFGTEAVRLSMSQAREIAQRSLAGYLPLVPREDIVARAFDPVLLSFALSARGVGFIIGESGVGKSAALRRLADQWLNDNAATLILDHTIVEQAATIEQAITLGLQKWMPALDAGSGRVALTLASPDRPLLLIVEDINLATNPRRIVERMIAWSEADAKNATEPEWRLLCPVWYSNAGLGDSQLRSHVLARSLNLGRFEPDEAIVSVNARARAAGVTLTQLQARDLAIALANDPLLIGLNSEWNGSSPRDAIQSYIDTQIDRAADERLLASDLRSALDMAAERMIQERNIAPSWEQIRMWNGANTDCLAGLRRLIDQRRIVWLNTDERLVYRHDRVRDHLFVHAIVRMITRGDFPPELWSEPFYAGLIGTALTMLPSDRVEKALKHNPVAIFAALQNIGLDREKHAQLLAAAEHWTNSPTFRDKASESRQLDAMRYLMRTDGDFVPRLARRFNFSFWKLEALARNGDAGAAATICVNSDPGVQDPWRDRIIAHAVSRHPQFVNDVVALLNSSATAGKQLEGVLNLIGEIGDPLCCDALAARWASTGAGHLTSGWLWATLRCCPPIGHPLVDDVCCAWASLPSKGGRSDRNSNPRWDIAGYSLPWGLSRRLEPATLTYLIGLAKRHRGLKHVIGTIINHIDTPEAIVWSAKRLAAIDRQNEGTRRINLWRSQVDRRWSTEYGGRALSAASREALARRWSNRRLNKYDRETAFRLWAITPSSEDVAALPQLEADPVLADEALKARLSAGDESAVPLLRQRLWAGDRGWRWWYEARRVSLIGLKDDIRRYFAARRLDNSAREDDHIVAELLMDSRNAFAADVIVENWDQLSTSPDFVAAALYLATPDTIALGRAAVLASDKPARLLGHINMRWGIRVFGRPGVTTIEQLKGLEPLLAIIGEGEHGQMQLGYLFESANRLGAIDWRKQHLDPLMTETKFGHCPFDRDALYASLDNELEHAEQYNRDWLRVNHWFEDREKELLPRAAILALIADWANIRAQDLAIRFLCSALVRFGERRDLALLDNLPHQLQQSCTTTIANCVYEVRRRSLE